MAVYTYTATFAASSTPIAVVYAPTMFTFGVDASTVITDGLGAVGGLKGTNTGGSSGGTIGSNGNTYLIPLAGL